MTEQLDRTTIVRLAWLTELRRQGDRQCRGSYFDHEGGTLKACALGLLGEVAGLSRTQVHDYAVSEIGKLAGLTPTQTEHVWTMNDGEPVPDSWDVYHKHTFAEIARAVEGWFKS